MNRDTARQLGEIYYRGRVCRNGHDSLRYTTSGECCECKKLRGDSRKNRKRDLSGYRKDNHQRIEEIRRAYYKKNRETIIAMVMDSRQKRLIERATFPGVDDESILNLYIECQRLNEKIGGYDFRVVHIIPLAGRIVCGLHVPENLKIGTESFDMARDRCFTKAQQESESQRHMNWLKQRGL